MNGLSNALSLNFKKYPSIQMLIPYSTALTFAKPPLATYGTVVLCFIVFLLQTKYSITGFIKYYPDSWNPITMMTSSLAHGSWSHIIWNMVFYLAFAPALEVIINNKIKYIKIMLFIAFVVGISYSLSVIIRQDAPIPSLGFSGVVMGMIGLSAYLIPTARIKVFWWYIFAGKTFYVQAKVLAIFYIGLDTWTMLTVSDYGYINVVAHVGGGFAGYFYGYFWLKELKEEIKDELAHEMKAMKILRTEGEIKSNIFRDRTIIDANLAVRQKQLDFDKLMREVHQLATTHKDSEAICLLMSHYNLETNTAEFELIFDRVEKWGLTRTLLCLGRLIIHQQDKNKRYGRAICYIEKCQQLSPNFILADNSRVSFYIQTSQEMNKNNVANNLRSL